MAVKYECPKCGRRFAEWGAEKLGFKCPLDDRCPAGAVGEEISLVRVGLKDEATPSKASLRRKPKPVAAPVSTSDDDIEDSDVALTDDSLDIDDDDSDDSDEDEEEEVVVGDDVLVKKKKAVVAVDGADTEDIEIDSDDDVAEVGGDDALDLEDDEED
jgi:hypothetical protein